MAIPPKFTIGQWLEYAYDDDSGDPDNEIMLVTGFDEDGDPQGPIYVRTSGELDCSEIAWDAPGCRLLKFRVDDVVLVRRINSYALTTPMKPFKATLVDPRVATTGHNVNVIVRAETGRTHWTEAQHLEPYRDDFDYTPQATAVKYTAVYAGTVPTISTNWGDGTTTIDNDPGTMTVTLNFDPDPGGISQDGIDMARIALGQSAPEMALSSFKKPRHRQPLPDPGQVGKSEFAAGPAVPPSAPTVAASPPAMEPA